jgi:polyhydroxyalkanoate synthesis repressor PhaR
MSLPENAESNEKSPATGPVVVKKYANRRLYNTESSSYITLDNLAGMVRDGRDFVVYDARTGEDITRSVLTQIIVEEESKGRAMLPTNFLRQIIGFYGDSLQQFVPSYLEQAMSSFALQQEQMRNAMQQTMGNFFPLNIQEVSRQNLAMMERAMSLFTPFRHSPGEAQEAELPPVTEASEEVESMRQELQDLRSQLAAAKATAAAQAKAAVRPRRESTPAPAKEDQ